MEATKIVKFIEPDEHDRPLPLALGMSISVARCGSRTRLEAVVPTAIILALEALLAEKHVDKRTKKDQH